MVSLDEAIETYDALLVVAPRHAEGLSGRGVVLARLGRFEESLASFEAAVESDATLTKGWYNLGLALHKSGCNRRARVSFERALELEVDHVRAIVELGS